MTRAERIRGAVVDGLRPVHVDVVDESHMHSVPPGAESHFKLVVASEAFEGKTRVARHRMVHELLGEELRAGLHALTVSAFTRAEWEQSPEVLASPACRGGSKADAR